MNNVIGCDPFFVQRLTIAEFVSGIEYVVTSGFRSVVENRDVGGVHNSAHLVGLAVDLAASDGATRFRILKGLLSVGFVRIGIYEGHIHVDGSLTLPQNVIFN